MKPSTLKEYIEEYFKCNKEIPEDAVCYCDTCTQAAIFTAGWNLGRIASEEEIRSRQMDLWHEARAAAADTPTQEKAE